MRGDALIESAVADTIEGTTDLAGSEEVGREGEFSEKLGVGASSLSASSGEENVDTLVQGLLWSILSWKEEERGDGSATVVVAEEGVGVTTGRVGVGPEDAGEDCPPKPKNDRIFLSWREDRETRECGASDGFDLFIKKENEQGR